MKIDYQDHGATASITLTSTVFELRRHISYQLNYSNGDNAWRRRAGMALHKCKSIRVAIQCKLAVLRQEEKEKNAELHQRHSDFLVKELMAVVPLETFQECDQRAKKKAEGNQ